VTSGRPFSRVRQLVGFCNGYLVSIAPASSLRTSSVDILVRFPRNSTVRGFWEDIVDDPSLAAGFGRRKRMPRSRRKDVLVGDGSVLLRLTYDVLPPRASRVERVTKGLVDALSHHMRPLDFVCEICGHDRSPDVYLADGIPTLVCESCLEDFRQRERDYSERVRAIPPDIRRGVGLGVGAAFAFGLTGGALAAVPRIVLPSIGFILSLAFLAGVGYAVSLFMSRGFGGSNLQATATKIPAAVLGGLVAFVASNAVTSMTITPEPLSLWVLYGASLGAAIAVPANLAMMLAATLAGWLVESVVDLVQGRRQHRATSLERVEIVQRSDVRQG